MDDRLLSVIVPARDAAETLPALLAALEAQVDAGPFEVVIADDGSRDATPYLARAAGARVAHTARPGSGPGAARNTGLALARGSLLAFYRRGLHPDPRLAAPGPGGARTRRPRAGRRPAPSWPADRAL